MRSDPNVRTVHLVFKTHLDLGFTDLAENVARRYRESFVPRAIRLAEESRAGERRERFVWTIGSWLLWDYLEHSDAQSRQAMDRAIAAGDLHWLAVPFTTHTEFLDASLFEFGLSLSKRLDARYGRHTVSAKMTDVPGHTRSMIPMLASAGVQFLHLGINPSSPPPSVPPLFRWQEPNGSELIVMVQKDYGQVAVLPDGVTAVAVSHTGDNYGPPEMMVVDEAYWSLRRQFPNATIEATNLNQVAECVCALRSSLQVVTSEIGDTWIHGTGTDPTKVRRFRELSRLRRQWLASGTIQAGSETDTAFSLPLLAVAEHTWGLDEKAALGDYSAYDPESFEKMRTGERCRRFEASWLEQRAYLDQALAALGDSVLGEQARESLQATEPELPDLSDYEPVGDPCAPIETKHFTLAFATDGSIAHLSDKATGRQWADPNHRLFHLRHQTFSYADCERFLGQYAVIKPFWAVTSFTKLGMDKADQESRFWDMELVTLYRHPARDVFVAELRRPEECAPGCPKRFFLTLTFDPDRSAFGVDLQWFDKAASRLPEALWLSCQPMGVDSTGWRLDKMGQEVDPLDVVPNGNRKLHAVDRFVGYADARGSFCLETLDTCLVAPGEPSLLQFDNRQPPIRRGVHFNLYNNVWCTNFPMWFSDDARFRFRFSLAEPGELPASVTGIPEGKDRTDG